jgi:uncharacterized protein (DUF924 family)
MHFIFGTLSVKKWFGNDRSRFQTTISNKFSPAYGQSEAEAISNHRSLQQQKLPLTVFTPSAAVCIYRFSSAGSETQTFASLLCSAFL